MLKNAYNASPLSVSRETIQMSATRFLQRLAGNDLLVPADGMASTDLGVPDLAFVKRGMGDITVAMVHCQGDFAGFALRAAAYHRWLKECVHLSETILSRTIGLDLYLISHETPSADSYLLKVISDISGLFFVKYEVLDIEEQQAPVLHFHLLDMNPRAKDQSDGKRGLEAEAAALPGDGQSQSEYVLSSHEIEEFNLLKQRYL